MNHSLLLRTTTKRTTYYTLDITKSILPLALVLLPLLFYSRTSASTSTISSTTSNAQYYCKKFHSGEQPTMAVSYLHNKRSPNNSETIEVFIIL
jgi:hypothetical protein